MPETISETLDVLDKQLKAFKEIRNQLIELFDGHEMLSEIDRDFRIVFRAIDLIYEKSSEHDLNAPSIILLDSMSLYTQAVLVLTSKIKDNGLIIDF